MFRPFAQKGVDRTGIGLGLSISRRAVEANGVATRLPLRSAIELIPLPLRATSASLSPATSRMNATL